MAGKHPEAVRHYAEMNRVKLIEAEQAVQDLADALCVASEPKLVTDPDQHPFFYFLRYARRYLSEGETVFLVIHFATIVALLLANLIALTPFQFLVYFSGCIAGLAISSHLMIFSWLSAIVTYINYHRNTFTFFATILIFLANALCFGLGIFWFILAAFRF